MSEVITTASGLQYEVLASGDGRTPGPTDTVSAHYHGTFTDGRVFDSSVERGEPLDLPVNGVIQGWQEALQMMKEGDKWRLTVPPELGYGANGVGPIPGNTTLIFEVELIKGCRRDADMELTASLSDWIGGGKKWFERIVW